MAANSAPRVQNEAIAKAIPGAGRAIVTRCGPMLPLEQPRALAGAIDPWLQPLTMGL